MTLLNLSDRDDVLNLSGELESRRKLVRAADVTLDGAAAIIIGVRNDYATVARLDGRYTAVFAWQTVQRIVDAGGAFTG